MTAAAVFSRSLIGASLANQCARVLFSVAVSGVIVAAAVSTRYCDELDSRPRRSENSANSYSRLESWRSI
jgi:hypothetical protein